MILRSFRTVAEISPYKNMINTLSIVSCLVAIIRRIKGALNPNFLNFLTLNKRKILA